MRFGNSLGSLRGGIAVMTVVGLLLALVGCVTGITHHTLMQRWPGLIGLILIPPGGFLAGCAPTLLFSVWLEDGRVKHLFCNRVVLSDFPVADFKTVQIWRAPWGAVIQFHGGKKIRFLGAHLGVLGALQAALPQAKLAADKSTEFTGPLAGSATGIRFHE